MNKIEDVKGYEYPEYNGYPSKDPLEGRSGIAFAGWFFLAIVLFACIGIGFVVGIIKIIQWAV